MPLYYRILSWDGSSGHGTYIKHFMPKLKGSCQVVQHQLTSLKLHHQISFNFLTKARVDLVYLNKG